MEIQDIFLLKRFKANENKEYFSGSNADIWASGLIVLELLTNCLDLEEFLGTAVSFQEKIKNDQFFSEKFGNIEKS